MGSFTEWLRNRFGGRAGPAVQQLQDLERHRVEAAAALPFERIETTGEAALATWEALRNAGRGWPIVVGGDRELGILAESRMYEERTPEAILAAAETLAMPSALSDLRKRDGETARAWLAQNNPAALAEARDEAAAPEVGPWPLEPAPSTGCP